MGGGVETVCLGCFMVLELAAGGDLANKKLWPPFVCFQYWYRVVQLIEIMTKCVHFMHRIWTKMVTTVKCRWDLTFCPIGELPQIRKKHNTATCTVWNTKIHQKKEKKKKVFLLIFKQTYTNQKKKKKNKQTNKILRGPRTTSVACCRGLWMMQVDIWPWSHSCWGRQVVLIGTQVCKWVKIYLFRLSYRLTSDNLCPWLVTFDLMNIQRFPSINQVWFQLFHLFKWDQFQMFSLTTWSQMTFYLGIWPPTSWTYEGSHIIFFNKILIILIKHPKFLVRV